MSDNSNDNDTFYCSFVSIHYIICECGKTFPSEGDLREHLDKEHPHKRERKEYQCGVCQLIYSTEQECIDHYEESHIDVKEEPNDEDHIDGTIIKDEHDYVDQSYIIEPDDLTEYGEEVYIENTQDVEQIEIKEEKKMKKKKKQYYKSVVCEVCGRGFSSNAALRYHQRIHTGERPYICQFCKKTFTMPLFLQIHIRTHTGERPYQCLTCPKAFGSRAALLRHERVHTGVKPYVCPKCGKAFTQSNSMKLHVNTVHLKMPAPYKSKSRLLKAQQKQMQREAALQNDNEAATEKLEPNNEKVEVFEVKEEEEEVEMYQQEIESEVLYEEESDGKGVTYQIVYTY